MLENIKSYYFLEITLNHLLKKNSFEIIKYNKKIQQRLNITINDYRKYSEMYSSIEIEIIPAKTISGYFINISQEDLIFYHIYFNDNKKETKITTIDPFETISKIKIIIDYQVQSFFQLFKNCSVKSINFKKFARNNINNMNHMFNTRSIKEINFYQFNTENVTDMGGMFSGCTLKQLDLSKFNTINVKDMSAMFCSCDFLKELDLSNFRTYNVTNMRSMFCWCKSLEKVNLSNFNTENVTDMNSMFCSCHCLTKLDISNFKFDKVNDMIHMFLGCKSLKELTMSNVNIRKETKMGNMFFECPKELQKKIRKHFKNIKKEAFGETCNIF